MHEDLIPRFVRVPGREFSMGSDEGADDERPGHRVQVDSFYASAHPITVEQYAEFTRETGHPCPEIRDLPRIVAPAGESSFRELAASHIWHNG
jgi:formylglycine-generating enzyme required for sulfatase activity